MSSTLSSADVYAAVLRVCRMIEEQEAAFNRLDANTGDGDMGSTLRIVASAIAADTSPPPADLGQALGRLAMVVAKTSGSSLSAVIMTPGEFLEKPGRAGCGQCFGLPRRVGYGFGSNAGAEPGPVW